MPSCSAAAMVRIAEEVGVVGHLEVAVGLVEGADEAQAIGPIIIEDGAPTLLAAPSRGVRVAEVQAKSEQCGLPLTLG